MQNIPHRLIPVAFTALIVLSVSCSGKKEMDIDTGQDDFAGILVPESRLPLYADMEPFGRDLPGTRASEKTYTLEQLIDRSRGGSIESGEVIFAQIPFHEDGFLAGTGPDAESCTENTAEIRKYYIARKDFESKRTRPFIATVIPSPGYAANHPGYSFTDMPQFSGYVIFSRLDGRVFAVRSYTDGMISPARLVKKGETLDEDEFEITLLKVFTRKGTRSSMDDTLDESYCIAKRKKRSDTTDWNWLDNYDQVDEHDDDSSGDEGGGGGGGNYNNGNKDIGDSFTVSLNVNIPESVRLYGSGVYTKNSYANIGYDQLLPAPYLVYFRHWIGDLSDKTTARLNLKVTKNINAYAWFEDGKTKLPCISSSNVATPLIDMRIAASGTSNYNGGTYGYTRTDFKTKQAKMHHALDLYCEPGTQLYSMYNGEIYKIYDSAKEGKKGETDNGKLGNQIVVKSKLPDGRTIYVYYNHLQYGDPIDTNPLTGEKYKEGDEVYAGMPIGFSGDTGNAWNVPNKHVHLGIRINSPTSAWTDPKPFINGTYDATSVKNGGTIYGIQCN